MFSLVPHRSAFEEVDPLRWSDDLYRWPAVVNRYLAESLGNFGGSQVSNTDKEFRIRLDVKEFSPEEIHIKSDNNKICVHGKHEEKQANHGSVCREFTRTYKLPDNVDPKSVTSTMNSHGILNITFEKKVIEDNKDTPIPIQFTG